MTSNDNIPLADDLLHGAASIAAFIFGRSDTKNRRAVYHLAENSRLPVFRLGATVCARRSTITAWVSEQERANAA